MKKIFRLVSLFLLAFGLVSVLSACDMGDITSITIPGGLTTTTINGGSSAKPTDTTKQGETTTMPNSTTTTVNEDQEKADALKKQVADFGSSSDKTVIEANLKTMLGFDVVLPKGEAYSAEPQVFEDYVTYNVTVIKADSLSSVLLSSLESILSESGFNPTGSVYLKNYLGLEMGFVVVSDQSIDSGETGTDGSVNTQNNLFISVAFGNLSNTGDGGDGDQPTKEEALATIQTLLGIKDFAFSAKVTNVSDISISDSSVSMNLTINESDLKTIQDELTALLKGYTHSDDYNWINETTNIKVSLQGKDGLYFFTIEPSANEGLTNAEAYEKIKYVLGLTDFTLPDYVTLTTPEISIDGLTVTMNFTMDDVYLPKLESSISIILSTYTKSESEDVWTNADGRIQVTLSNKEGVYSFIVKESMPGEVPSASLMANQINSMLGITGFVIPDSMTVTDYIVTEDRSNLNMLFTMTADNYTTFKAAITSALADYTYDETTNMWTSKDKLTSLMINSLSEDQYVLTIRKTTEGTGGEDASKWPTSDIEANIGTAIPEYQTSGSFSTVVKDGSITITVVGSSEEEASAYKTLLVSSKFTENADGSLSIETGKGSLSVTIDSSDIKNIIITLSFRAA